MKKLLLLLMFFPCISFANEECQDISTGNQVHACAKATRDDSEKELNNTYNSLISKINKVYNINHKLRNEYIEKINKSQNSWLRFRDRNCDMRAFQIDSEKPAYETSINYCISDMSNKRNEELLMILDSI